MNSQEFFRSLDILFFAMLVGQVLFAGVVYFLLIDGNADDSLNSIFMMAVPFLGISGFLGGRFLYQQQLGSLTTTDDLTTKMDRYRTANILRFALMEMPALLAIVAYLLTENIVFLGMAVLVMVFFYTLRPSRDKAIGDLNLNGSEKAAVNNPNATIASPQNKTK